MLDDPKAGLIPLMVNMTVAWASLLARSLSMQNCYFWDVLTRTLALSYRRLANCQVKTLGLVCQNAKGVKSINDDEGTSAA